MSYFQDLPFLDNLDDPAFLARVEKSVLDREAANFALSFDDSQALGALNINANDLGHFLDAEKLPVPNQAKVPSGVTRWINFWTPNEQRESLGLLAKRYGFSARLLKLMETEPPVPSEPAALRSTKEETAVAPKAWDRVMHGSDDYEHHAGDFQSVEMVPAVDQALKLNHYAIVREIWHFFSVDVEPKYVCIGYNSLYNTSRSDRKKRPLEKDNTKEQEKKQIPKRDSSKPAGTRAWTWLVLCEDNTVISIHENLREEKVAERQQDLAIIRRHIKHVLRRLSRPATPIREDNPIMTLTLRRDFDPGAIEPLSSTESSNLLFYYLFDDWYTSYSLVARKEHQYGAKLEELRQQMFQNAAELEQVNRLHQYGRQLSVLKKIYQSYDRIIQRLLERQKAVASHEQLEVQGPRALLIPNPLGTPLHSAAIVRFQALKDRINLFPLSEIDECLNEKDALVQVSFNLIGLKQARFVDRLTRITILLAKATILFLPVSLMTAYFTIPMSGNGGNDAVYTAEQYWITFAVIIVVSYVVLVVFGYLSGTQDTKTIYESLASIFIKKVRGKSGKARDRDTELDHER